MLYIRVITVIALIGFAKAANAQPFYFGADMSYVNELEHCGAVYKANGVLQDPYAIMKDNGCNLIRLRLWHTPSWYDQLNDGTRYCDFEDVRLSILRAKSAGMQVLLDFHLSDTWADPGHQVVPAAWNAVVDNQTLLADSLYNYVQSTLTRLGNDGLLPDIVQIGNETNRGILLSQQVNDQGWTLDWQRNVFLFQSALNAIHDVAQLFSAEIKTAIHIADPSSVAWYVEQFTLNGFTEYDIIGISYYWQWHQPATIGQVGQLITSLKNNYPDKEVMVFETAYGWTTQNADASNNILFNAHPSYAPLSPANQQKWMIDLTREVIAKGGSGVIYWEPAWVSTGCFTQWAQGSAWDNATFFDFDNELMEDGGVGWMRYPYDFTSSTQDVSAQTRALKLCYNDEEIIISNSSDLNSNFPLSLTLYAIDGRQIQSRKITVADEQIIRIPVSGILPGCYAVSILDSDLLNSTGLICITSH